VAQQQKFDLSFPKEQRFDKSKFGKSWNTYRMEPHTVCLGAMKNFAEFNTWLQGKKEEDWKPFFIRTVALVTMWNEAERIVRRQKFGGYFHQIVTYTLSWFHHLTNRGIDLQVIWKQQAVPEAVREAIEILCHAVNRHIRDTDLNVTEYCKKEACWEKLKNNSDVPDFPGISQYRVTGSVARPEPVEQNEAVEFCKSKGGSYWVELAEWLKEKRYMSIVQRSQCKTMGRILTQGRDPRPRLAYPCREIWQKAQESFEWGIDDGDSHIQ
jgi:hypothetical protein